MNDTLAGLTTPTVDVDAWQKRMDAKREQLAHFRELDASVIAAASRPVKKSKQSKATGQRTYRVTDDMVGTCPSCGRSTRPTAVPLAAMPGTVPRVHDGLCRACANRGGPPVARRDPVRPCTGCGRMTRPSHLNAADCPGTLSRVSTDLCAACSPRNRAARRQEQS